MRAPRLLSTALLLSLAGCLSPPTLPPRPDVGTRDGGHDAWLPPFAVVGVEVRDAHGRGWPLDAAPRSPVVRVTFASAPSDPLDVLLLEGETDADLLDDLEATPYRTTTLDRELDATRTLSGATLTLTPSAPLDRGAAITLAIPRWLSDAGGHRLDAALAQTITIADRLDAGARATDAWPPDGAFEVAPALAIAAVRFDGTLEDATHAAMLSEAHGGPVLATPSVVPCATLGWAEGVCVTLVPLAPLAPSTEHVVGVAASAHDATGVRVPAFTSRFTTAGAAPPALAWTAPACGIGETSDATGCTRADDESVAFHGQLSAAARVAWTAFGSEGALVAPRGAVSVRVEGLATETPLRLMLRAIDYAGDTTSLALPLTTTEPLPTLSITEVRADPAGPEPRQEFVEIENYGALPVSLAGMHLADAASAIGDALPGVAIPAGAHALIVPADFDPDATAGGADVATPPGALLVRVDASLGSGGLSNTGEPLFLRDAMDRWVSAAPAAPPPRQGVCIVRTSRGRRVGEPGSFGYDPALTCTPGR